jgi:dihydroxy-acid dehydratase
MGTALSMNCLAEALGMALPGTAQIPGPYRERGQAAHGAGMRIVRMVEEDLRPARIVTRAALLNCIRVNTALGGSTNCPPHIIAVARHAGIELEIRDWETFGHDLPLLVDLQPAGAHLGEDFHRAGGLPTVMAELLRHGLLDGTPLTVSGRTVAENVVAAPAPDGRVIRTVGAPLRERAGFLVLSGNLFDAALLKTSVISADFRRRFLSEPGAEETFECRAVVFDGPEDYHARIDDAALAIDETTLLVIRGCGTLGFPGSGEVVNMLPPEALVRRGISELPTLGDGRQSGTAASPSILNASPEAYAGGGLARLRTGDRVRVDLKARRVEALVAEGAWKARDTSAWDTVPTGATPWQQLYRDRVGQLHTGGCLDFACTFRDVCRSVPRHSH